MAKISDALASLPAQSRYFSLEFFPPKTAESLSPLFVCVTFGAGGTTAAKSVELANICQNQFGFRTCLHLTCTNTHKDKIDWVLEECKRLGIRNILALRGDEPRESEYAGSDCDGSANGTTFCFATDLITYIRKQHGDYFCIGAAAYPEGHPVVSVAHAGGYLQSPEHDLPYLRQKVEAGAEFLITQLFYNAESYLQFESLMEKDAVLKTVPLIPGLMPVQGWQSFTRTCTLARVKVPDAVRARLEETKGDDEAVKDIGIDIVSEIVNKIQRDGSPRGFHFYTLNLEKSIAIILNRCRILPPNSNLAAKLGDRRRSSSAHNRVVISRNSSPAAVRQYEVREEDASLPRDKPTSEEALVIAEGEGSRGREATWDDFPNGRWGDARSPAYAPTNNYILHPNLNRTSALRLWGTPTSSNDVTSIFRRYLLGELSATPWSEEDTGDGLAPETALIQKELLRLNDRGWWTVASQPAVNAVSSDDKVVGWGPRKGGFVWQKPFVEFFLSSQDWAKLKARLDKLPDRVSYFAGNAAGDFEATDKECVNPVTWGSFKGKE